MNERDFCVRKDYVNHRDERRIDVICNKMLKLWEQLRLNNSSVGFVGLIEYIEGVANNKYEDPNCTDPFYWEEDRWYDELDEMISNTKQTKQDNILDRSLEMMDTMNYFKMYWNLYGDFRLYQVIYSFKESFEQKIRDIDVFDNIFWKSFFVKEIINSLTSSLESIQKAKKNLPESTFAELYDELEATTKKKLEEVRKEYLIW